MVQRWCYMAAMWWVLLLGCSTPDPDSLLRTHQLDGAADAWAKLHGERPDIDHRVMDVLGTRAAHDPTITFASALSTLQAVRLLERNPGWGNQELDTGFDRPSDLLAAAAAVGRPSAFVAVGRSETGLDRDPYVDGAIPWARGRLVGFAPPDVTALGRRLDDDPPARLVTFAFEDGTGWFSLSCERRPDGWWTINSNNVAAAGRLVQAASWGRDNPGDDLAGRYPGGLVPPDLKPAP
jgi:hypothetical protein